MKLNLLGFGVKTSKVKVTLSGQRRPAPNAVVEFNFLVCNYRNEILRLIVYLIRFILCSWNRTCIDIKMMQNGAVNAADGELGQTVDVKLCKNWYVYLVV